MSTMTGKLALVTGGGRGVGAEIALQLASEGIVVAVNDLVAARAAHTVDKVVAAGGQAVAVPADVGDHNEIASALADLATTVGTIDILVNNAGIPAEGIELALFADTDPSSWDSLLRVNIGGVMNCAHAVIPAMRARGWGRIITISSDSGRTGESMLAVYAASKAAGAGFTRSLAKELGPDGITCNTLSLGTIGTPEMHRTAPETMARNLRRYPAGRLGKASDVAAAVLWLCSDGGEWTTGQTIPINGGFATS